MRLLAALVILTLGVPPAIAAEPATHKVAALVSMYTPDSHADVIVTRLLKTSTLDGRGRRSPLSLASLYTDQRPPRDISRRLAAEHRFPIYANVRDALTLGTGRLAVEGVLVIFEHGDYPMSPTGQAQYPKRRVFDEIVRVFDESGRVVPVFIDKHLADTWTDAKAIYDEAQRRKIPLMAGSSLPTLWRYPPLDVEAGKPLKEMVAVTFHTLDAYGFHALEMAQCLAERRGGGETGVRSVRTLVDEEVWRGGETGLYDRALLDAAVKKVLWRPYAGDDLRKTVAHPVLWMVDYKDGLRVSILTLNYAVGQWAAAWRYRDTSEVANLGAGELGLEDQEVAPAEVDSRRAQRLFHRQCEVPVAADAGLVAQCLAQGLAEADAHVFNRVVLVDVQIAFGRDRKIERSVLGK